MLDLYRKRIVALFKLYRRCRWDFGIASSSIEFQATIGATIVHYTLSMFWLHKGAAFEGRSNKAKTLSLQTWNPYDATSWQVLRF